MHIEGWGGPRTKLYIAEHTFFLQREIIMFLTDVPDGNKRKNQQKKENKTQFSFSQIQSSILYYREGWKTLKGDDTTRTITTTIISNNNLYY